MPGGGTLAIETRDVVVNETQAGESKGFNAGPIVMMRVEDSGIGMDRDTLEHAFEPFFTTKGMGKGTGLGLATVYGIVKQHGGHISVASEPGHGTVFSLYFPRAGTSKGPSGPAANPAREMNGTETILLTEDEADVRSLAARILSRLGYTVLQAGNAAAAIQQSKTHAGPLHLLVTDVVLPDQNGRIIYETIAGSRRETRVLYMSGYAGEVISSHGLLDEGIDFLPKPFTAQMLATRVREILDRT
jgi:CheY-like chemotaxis protein